MKKQNLLKGALLLTTLSIIVLNVYFVASKNASRLNIGSFNIEALTGSGDGENGDQKLGPSNTSSVGVCDQRYVIYYTLSSGKATVHNASFGANVEVPFKIGNASANANYNGNWNNNNSSQSVLEKKGGRNVNPNEVITHCSGYSQPCFAFDPCTYATEESRISFKKDLDLLLSLQ